MSGPAPHVLTAAFAFVDHTTWPSTSYQILGYLGGHTVCVEDMGTEGVIGISARTLATRCGLSPTRTFKAMERLTALRVLLCRDAGKGRASKVWSINGDLTEWAVGWLPERTTVLNYLAAFANSTPGRGTLRQFCVPGASVDGNTTADLYVPLVVHRGPLVAQSWGGRRTLRGRRVRRAAMEPEHNGTPYTMPLEPPPSSEVLSSSPTRKDQPPATAGPGGPPHRGDELAPAHDPLSLEGVTRTLAAIHRATGRALWGDVQARVASVVAGVEDVGYIVEALDAAKIGRGRWRDAVALVELLARTGPTTTTAPATDRSAEPRQLRVALTHLQLELESLERDGGTAAERDEVLARMEDLRAQLRACQDCTDQEATG